ncbi:MAG: hypothetical protein WCP55_00040 [Lentisphaerota bacterium]
MVFAFLFGFKVQRCTAPLPVGETGVANGKPLRGAPKSKAVFALAKRPLSFFWRKGLGEREGSALRLTCERGRYRMAETS